MPAPFRPLPGLSITLEMREDERGAGNIEWLDLASSPLHGPVPPPNLRVLAVFTPSILFRVLLGFEPMADDATTGDNETSALPLLHTPTSSLTSEKSVGCVGPHKVRGGRFASSQGRGSAP